MEMEVKMNMNTSSILTLYPALPVGSVPLLYCKSCLEASLPTFSTTPSLENSDLVDLIYG